MMKEFGLTLHPDRDQPATHEMTDEHKRSAASIEAAREEADQRWWDREFIIGQARAVTAIFRRAWCFLKDGRDDPELFAVIVRALRQIPPIGNPVFDDLKRVEDAEQSQAARAAEMEEAARAREAANRRIAELVREAGTINGNVIAFPVAAMRAIPQIGGAA
jgi:hypothetical protein